MMSKKFFPLLMALLLSVVLISPVLAVPEESTETAVSESITQTDTNEDDPFGKSYLVKGVIVVGVGVIFYVVLVIKSKGRKK